MGICLMNFFLNPQICLVELLEFSGRLWEDGGQMLERENCLRHLKNNKNLVLGIYIRKNVKL